MAVKAVLLLGNPALYAACEPVRAEEMPGLAPLVRELHDTLMDFRRRRGTGSAIAAPQIGVPKRLVVFAEEGLPAAVINPQVETTGQPNLEFWESCMSFPDLLVKTRRFGSCGLVYYDRSWVRRSLALTGELAVTAQHECDHLDGVLAVSRAADARSFCLQSQWGSTAGPAPAPGPLRAKSRKW